MSEEKPSLARSVLIITIGLIGYLFEFLIEWPFRLVMGLDHLFKNQRR